MLNPAFAHPSSMPSVDGGSGSGGSVMVGMTDEAKKPSGKGLGTLLTQTMPFVLSMGSSSNAMITSDCSSRGNGTENSSYDRQEDYFQNAHLLRTDSSGSVWAGHHHPRTISSQPSQTFATELSYLPSGGQQNIGSSSTMTPQVSGASFLPSTLGSTSRVPSGWGSPITSPILNASPSLPSLASLATSRRTIRVSGLPKSMTAASFRELLSELNLLDDEDPRIALTMPGGGGCGASEARHLVATVCLSKYQEAVEKLHGARIGDFTLEAQVHFNGDATVETSTGGTSAAQLSVTQRFTDPNATVNNSMTTSPSPRHASGGSALTTSFSASFTPLIFRLRGLPFTSRDEDVHEFLRPVGGGVCSVCVCRCPEGRCTGDAFVEVSNVESAAFLRQLHGKMMGPRYIEVIPSTAHDRTVIMRSAASKGRHHRIHHSNTQSAMGPQRSNPMPAASLPPFSNAQPSPTLLFSSSSSTPMTSGVFSIVGDPHAVGISNSSSAPAFFSASGSVIPAPSRQHGIVFSAPAAPNLAASPGMPVASQGGRGGAVVRVSGLPAYFTEEMLASCFADVRIAPQGVHLVVNELGQATGTAIVELASVDELPAALRHHQQTVDQHTLTVCQQNSSSIIGLSNAVAPQGHPALPQAVLPQRPPPSNSAPQTIFYTAPFHNASPGSGMYKPGQHFTSPQHFATP